tara:strand:- start:801 stop:1334 length:534 start_codon:yes stop_codon:yes gene_type:complete
MTRLAEEPSFDRPVPGMALTAELGGRPWQNPPQYTSIDEVLDFYVDRMSSEEFIDQAVDILEMGVPVTMLANTIQLANVMEGLHTVDTGTLALPVIMEMLMMLGDSANIEYTSGLDNPNTLSSKNPTRKSLLAKATSRYKDVLDEADFEPSEDADEEELDEEEEEVIEPSGLMARRG